MTDLSPEAKALVDLARDGDSPTAEDRARLRRALAAGIAAGVTGSSLSAAAASKSALGAGTGAAAKTTMGLWLVAGAVVGLAGSAALFVAGSGQRSADAARAAQAPAQPMRAALAAPLHPGADERDHETAVPLAHLAPSREAARGTSPAAAARPPAPAPAREDTGRPRAASPDDSAVSAFPGPRGSTLGAETVLLEAARTALGQGDAASALALLERHEREFPSGVLVEERLAAKVFALCGLGRRGEAVRTAARLLQISPNSPLRARVLDSCAYRP